MKYLDIESLLGKGTETVSYCPDIITTDDVRKASDKPIGNAGIAAALMTQKACVVTDFEDAEKSELAKSEIYVYGDWRKTGEFIGHSLVRSAHDAIIPIVSLYAHTLSYNLGKRPYELLKPGYTKRDILRVAKQDVALEDNDFRSQAALDNAKNANDLSMIFKSGIPQPTTHESDIWHRSGTKQFSTKDADGRIVTKYKADYRSAEYDKKFIDRSESFAPDKMLLDHVKSTTEDGYYFDITAVDGKDVDAQGIPFMALTDRALGRIDFEAEYERNAYIYPCDFTLPGSIDAVSFERWNKTSDGGQKVAMRFEKDVDRWALCDIAYKLYKGYKKNGEVEAYSCTIRDICELIISVTGKGDADDKDYQAEVACFLSNTALFRAIPKEVNLGITEEDGKKAIQFSRAKMITFQQMAELFGELWLNAKEMYADQGVEIGKVAEEKRKATIEELLECVANKKKTHADDKVGDFCAAINDFDEDAIEVE